METKRASSPIRPDRNAIQWREHNPIAGTSDSGTVVDCTLRLRHGNQGQLWVIEIEGGEFAAFNLGKVSSYSAGGR
jgi:hypothetical protein